jgi:hypothetical protein
LVSGTKPEPVRDLGAAFQDHESALFHPREPGRSSAGCALADHSDFSAAAGLGLKTDRGEDSRPGQRVIAEDAEVQRRGEGLSGSG